MFDDIIENKRYLCPICQVANDPDVYAMEKHGKRWYHNICLQKALWFFMRNYDFKLDEHLRPIYCKRKKRIKIELDPERTKELFNFIGGVK
jgi:hypothetical protein